MELCVKCFFDNKPEFEKALNYLKPIVGNDMAYTGKDFGLTNEIYSIETYNELTQDQLNELIALCPIRPPVSKDVCPRCGSTYIAHGNRGTNICCECAEEF